MRKTINLLVLLIIMFSAAVYAQSNQSQNRQTQSNQSQQNQQKSPSEESVKRTKWNTDKVDRSGYPIKIVEPKDMPNIDFIQVPTNVIDAYIRGEAIICNDSEGVCYKTKQEIELEKNVPKILQRKIIEAEANSKAFNKECNRLVELEKKRAELYLSCKGKCDPKIQDDINNIHAQVSNGLKIIKDKFGEEYYKKALDKIRALNPTRK